MESSRKIILITGANGGLGFELAAQLLADPSNHVLLAARSVRRGQAAVAELESRKQSGSVEFVHVDVTDEESIEAAARSVESKHGRLDVLVNNAAISTTNDAPEVLSISMTQHFQTNATGPLLVVEAFVPLLRKSTTTPRIINVSSGAGSITNLVPINKGFGSRLCAYRSSKAALNMVTALQAAELGSDDAGGFKVFAYCPGFTASSITPMNTVENGAQPTSEGARPMLAIINGERDAEHGKFLHKDGQYPW